MNPVTIPYLFRVTSAGRELRRWQAYASYILTGGFVFYGFCGDGFMADQVFYPESTAASGKKDLQLGYACVRNR